MWFIAIDFISLFKPSNHNNWKKRPVEINYSAIRVYVLCVSVCVCVSSRYLFKKTAFKQLPNTTYIHGFIRKSYLSPHFCFVSSMCHEQCERDMGLCVCLCVFCDFHLCELVIFLNIFYHIMCVSVWFYLY